MSFDAQIQMVASTAKVGERLVVDDRTGKLASFIVISLSGGARSGQLPEKRARIKFTEQISSQSTHEVLGFVRQSEGCFDIQLQAPRMFLENVRALLPSCRLDDGGYLSLNLLLEGQVEEGKIVDQLRVISCEYKAVERLAEQEDLLNRT